MKNYGSLDWDHSGDEFEKIQVAPKLTRRRASLSPKTSDGPLRVRDTLSLLPAIRGSYKSFCTIEKDKKAAVVRRDSHGRFIPKTPPQFLNAEHASSSKRKRKMPWAFENQNRVSHDADENPAPTSSPAKKRKRKIAKEAPSSLPSSADKSGLNKETQIPPPEPINSKQHGSPTEHQVEKTKQLSPRYSQDKIFSAKETSIPPTKPVTSSQTGSPSERITEEVGVLRDSEGKLFSPKETLIHPLKSVTSSPHRSASEQAVEKVRPTQQMHSQGKLLSATETSIKLPNSAVEETEASSETLTNKLPPIVRDSTGRFAPKKETLIPPPPVQFATISPNSKVAPAPPAENSPPDGPSVKNTLQVIIESTSEESKPKSKRAPARSPYFVPSTPKKLKISTETGSVTPHSSQKRPHAKTISCIPFPPLSAPYFGLIQEKLAHDPFKLLIAVTFLIRTHGKHAIPVFYELTEKYPTPESLIAADKEEGILPIIRHLGLQNQRANTYQTYAKIWLEDPPVKGKRYPVRGYPTPDSGRNASKGDILTDEDEREAWEIGHMTQGPYALDSWRIFCRDKLRGLANSWNGEGAKQDGFQPEWMRVVPEDKELRAYLRWMWLKEGFEWDPLTGEKEVASERLVRAAMEGNIAWDDAGGMRILDDGQEGVNE